MKPVLIAVLLMNVAAGAFADDAVHAPSTATVTQVATSLNHVTVLEFSEPVTMAASGSPAFEIERHDNKVLIKPLKSGASTDLIVWTISHRFTYELTPPGDVANMTFTIDSPIPAPKPAPAPTSVDQVADMLLSRAFLGAQRIDSSALKDSKNGVTIRIEHVFRSRNTVYIHYSIRNLTSQPCALAEPQVQLLDAPKSAVSVRSLNQTQLTERDVRALGRTSGRLLTVARFETQGDQLAPMHDAQGVIALREQLESPALVQMTFKLEAGREVRVTSVF